MTIDGSVSLGAMKRAWSRGGEMLILRYALAGADAQARLEEVLLQGDDLPESQQLAGDAVVVSSEDPSVCFLVVDGDLWTDLEPWLTFVRSNLVDTPPHGVLGLGTTYRRPRWLMDGSERIAYTALLRLDHDLPNGPRGQARPTRRATQHVLDLSQQLISSPPETRCSIDFGGPAVQLEPDAAWAAWHKLVSGSGFGVLHLDDHSSQTQRTVAVHPGSPYLALGVSMPAARGWQDGLSEITTTVMSIVGVVSVGGIARAKRLFPASLGPNDPRRNWKAWMMVALYPGDVAGVPEIFGWMLLQPDMLPHGDLAGWVVRPVGADDDGLVVVEATDREAWFRDLPPDDAVIREAQHQFVDVLWDRDRL
ncbi:hypothetical protein [Serinicoccus chungangensis]|uniref:hypothetical protein n=1 Tax=Serinicoccus chungangensis TaxID=767452 RepID=UPI0031EFD3A2